MTPRTKAFIAGGLLASVYVAAYGVARTTHQLVHYAIEYSNSSPTKIFVVHSVDQSGMYRLRSPDRRPIAGALMAIGFYPLCVAETWVHAALSSSHPQVRYSRGYYWG